MCKTRKAQEGLFTIYQESGIYEYVLVRLMMSVQNKVSCNRVYTITTRLTVQQDEANCPSQLAWV